MTLLERQEASTVTAVPELADPERSAARLQDAADRFAAKRRVPHVVLGVERVDGSFQWAGASGDADGEGTPMRADTPVCLASVTKTYTATTVMRLCEQGIISLDDRVVDHLGRDLIDGVHRIDGTDHTDEITIHHLLGHTSGLPDYYDDAPKGEKSLRKRLYEEAPGPIDLDMVLGVVRGLKPRFPPQDPSAPRARAHYADTNYQLLGAVVEAATGTRLSDVFRSMLFDPLGLGDTAPWSEWPTADRPPATIWLRDRPLDAAPMLDGMTPDGAMVATVADALRFLRALVTGNVFEDPDTLSLMQQRWSKVFYPVEYGLGLMRFRMGRLMSPLQPVPPAIGHTGSTGTWLLWIEDLDLIVAGAVDQAATPALPFRFLPRVIKALG